MKPFFIFSWLAIILVIGVASFIYLQIPKSNCQMFAVQSNSFIKGHLDIPLHADVTLANGKYYWPQGPFPSLILIPFQLVLGGQFDQSVMQPLLILLLSVVLFKLAKNKGFNNLNCLFLTYAFLFASLVIGIITEPCYSFFAHLITMVLLSIFLLEYETQKRWVVLGLVGGAILATRPTGSIMILLAGLVLLFSKTTKEKFLQLSYFLIPIFLSLISLFLFNFIRFQDFFYIGYLTNDVGDYLDSLRKFGVFNPAHFISNFYYYFLISVQPIIQNSTHLKFPYLTYNPVGLSFFIVSPFFLHSLKTLKFLSTQLKIYWASILITLTILLFYYNPGWVQFGPRLTSDFMPILYLLTLYSFKIKDLSRKEISIIILSSLLNSYLLLTGFYLFKR